MAYTQIGLTPDGSSSYFLARTIGLRRAKELALTNRVLSAAEALEWGIVNRVVPEAELAAAATEMAERLAAGATGAYGATKRLMLLGAGDALEAQMERETRTIAERARTHDAAEGISAFLAKRKPSFTGD